MRLKSKICSTVQQTLTYFKDYRFSSILLKYFLMLLVCLAVPVFALSFWYGEQIQDGMEQDMMKRNETSLEQAYDNVNSIILSMKNVAYSFSRYSGIKYLNTKSTVQQDTSGNLENLINMLYIVCASNEYLDSICVYFEKADEIVSNQGIYNLTQYYDADCLNMYADDLPNKSVIEFRKKSGKYPYLLKILNPIIDANDENIGAVIVNIDVEKLGDYIGSGQYRNKDYSPMMLIFDENMEQLVYSDEYRLLKDDTDINELKAIGKQEESFTGIYDLWGMRFVVSGVVTDQDGLYYLYLTSLRHFEDMCRAMNIRLVGVMAAIGSMCLVLACLLAIWAYNPIHNTVKMLEDVAMLTEWDMKEHVDEIEAIQRSILSAKQKEEKLNEQIQERIITLHNAQICALQTQINPHFLYNTLESIGNAAVLMMNGENQVTEMIYSLGVLMRISLSGENYLVPLKDELQHVELYVKLVDFRFRGRISLHMEIPDELKSEKVVKLTLQPLIENAIEHGLARRRESGDIWIIGEKKGEQNYIHVIDNGDGISEETLMKMQEQLKESAINGNRHIGLRNVDQRLKLIFGEEYGLTIGHSDNGGVRVTVSYKKI